MGPKNKKIFDYILEHQKAANERIYLVASENSPILGARLAFLSDIFARYYFPLEKNHDWAFPGNEFIEVIYGRCTELLGEVTGARHVTIRPISGVNAMTVALAALTSPGDTIATVSPENGGHVVTGAIARRLGVEVRHLPYSQEEFRVDTERLPDFVAEKNIKLIYLDKAHILFPFPLTEMRKSIPSHVPIYYDGSHVMGLIFGGEFQSPLKEGATFLGGSTHKTIPGPHKAFIATNDESGFRKIETASRFLISHDHGAEVAALAIVLEEMRGRWREYAAQVIKNAQCLSQELDTKGFTVVGKPLGFTKSHQIYVDIAPQMEAFEAVKALAGCNVIVNSIHAPSILDRLSLRIGVQELTYLGAKEDTMRAIAETFEEIFMRRAQSKDQIKKRVAEIRKGLVLLAGPDDMEKIQSLFRVS